MGEQVKLDGWMEQGFTSHSTQNKSFWRRSYQPIFFLGVVLKKTKINKTNLDNTKPKWSKLTQNAQKYKLSLYKNTKII